MRQLVDRKHFSSFLIRLDLELERVAKVTFFLVLFFFGLLAWRANVDLAVGRFALFMDEQISYDGVVQILHPGSWHAFLASLKDGGDQRYGRVFYNFTAIFSYIPSLVAGIPGMIVANRMAQVIFLYGSYCLLSLAFLEKWTLRTSCLLALLCLPFTPYYATMPKPEPVQLLLLSAFAYCHARRNFQFGTHWVLLGAACGAKISAFTTLPFLILFSVLRFRQKNLFTSFLSFCLGLGFSVPILFKGQFNRWIDGTFKNTGQGADDSAITILDWVRHISESYFGNYFFAVVLIISVLCLICLAMKKAAASSSFPRRWNAFVIILIGMSLGGPILLLVKRIWGFYLHPGAVFLFVGIFALISVSLDSNYRPLNRLARFTWVLTMVCALWTMLPGAIKYFEAESARSKSAEFIKNMKVYEAVATKTVKMRIKKGSSLYVGYDPELFQPDSTAEIRFDSIWGALKVYGQPYDLIVIKRRQTGDPSFRPNFTDTQPISAAFTEAWKQFQIHTRDPGATTCLAKPCYVRIPLNLETMYLVSEQRI